MCNFNIYQISLRSAYVYYYVSLTDLIVSIEPVIKNMLIRRNETKMKNYASYISHIIHMLVLEHALFTYYAYQICIVILKFNVIS